MDDFTKKDKYSSLNSAIKDIVSQNRNLYQESINAKYGIQEEVEQLDEAKGSTISFWADISKVRREVPSAKGLSSYRNNLIKALDQKFKAKLGNYKLKTTQDSRDSNIINSVITTDQKLSKKDDTDIHNYLVDKGLNLK